MTQKTVFDSDKHCGAKGRQSGQPCKRPKGWGTAHPGSGRCKLHGGASPGGIASATFKDGRYSKYLPGGLLENYQVALNDPELLSLRDEVALIDARLADLLARLGTGESAGRWSDTAVAWQRFTDAVKSRDRNLQQTAVSQLDELINQGVADAAAWVEVSAAIEQRRRLAEAERKRLVEAEQYITAQQAMTLVGGLIGIIKKNVTNTDQLRAISAEINSLTSRPAGV